MRKLALAVALVWLAWSALSARPKAPNVLLVTIDTLRPDHLGAYGSADARTPVLDALARGGVRFAFAQSAVPLTGPSHATILTGLYPPSHGVRDNVVFVLDPARKTLATRLRERGYHTAAFVAGFPVAAAFGFRQGFDAFDERLHQTVTGGEGAERPANEVADAVVGWLPSAATPFFAWVHFYDAHAPYQPPPPYAEAFRARPYDGEIAFVDAQLGRVLQALRAAGRDRDTLVVVVADHGESLGEHGEAAHAVLVYEATLHVPLIVAGPGVPAGGVVGTRVGTIDLAPTILDLAGLPIPVELPGRSLRPLLLGGARRPAPLYAESLFGRLNCRWAPLRAWTDGDWKLVQGRRAELFELADDPGETRDLASREPERVERMRSRLDAAVAAMAPGGDRAHTVPIAPEREETLRSLGYAASGRVSGELDESGLEDPRGRVWSYERLTASLAARAGGADAGDAVRAIAAADPNNPLAFFALAAVEARSGRYAAADAAFRRALALDPERPGMRLQYAQLLGRTGQLAEAERQLRAAFAQSPDDDATTRIALAEVLFRRGQAEEAGRLADAALAARPGHSGALELLGRLARARGAQLEASSYFARAAAAGETEAWTELAELHLDHGERAEAREALARVFAADPLDPWALAVAGRALVVDGDREHAAAFLGKALAIGPRHPEAWLSLARGFEALGDARRARSCRRAGNAAAPPS